MEELGLFRKKGTVKGICACCVRVCVQEREGYRMRMRVSEAVPKPGRHACLTLR